MPDLERIARIEQAFDAFEREIADALAMITQQIAALDASRRRIERLAGALDALLAGLTAPPVH